MATDEIRQKAEKATQAYAALGVGFVCLVVGLPLWWKTTETYRAQLPYSDIAQLGSIQLNYKVAFTVVVLDDSYDKAALATFGEKLRAELEFAGGVLGARYQGNIRHAFEEEKQTYIASTSLEDLDIALAKQRILQEHGKYYIVLLPKASTLDVGSGVVGVKRTAFLKVVSDLTLTLPIISHLVRDVFTDEEAMTRAVDSATGARHQQADKESMRAVRYHPGYEVTFTLLNPQPDILNVSWDIQNAIKKYMRPFLKSIRDYSEITVKSQYLHYTGLHMSPEKDASGNHFVLKQDSLPHIINPIEAHLSSHVSTNPNLNFIMYIPTRNQSPLYIYDNQNHRLPSNAFLSPRWGGMLIYNVETPEENASLPAPVSVNSEAMMETFLSQLRLLIGITTKTSHKGVNIHQAGNAGITQWEMDRWLRSRTLENIASSGATLTSLVQLLEEVGNIVINDHIASEVERAVTSIAMCQSLLSQGKLNDAFLASRQAILSSEKAFFDPSLLELLYFPEDQKFAIYIPLFLPISIPVILSLIQAVKWVRNKDKPAEKKD